ncbi:MULTISPECIES: carbon storage regulator CsrA [unclassified Idiomarina]|uniref:carbon storage regulator CsrA n=1 Tax=unclassified Idiomarina TaxID=2614829 RepID=UPI000C905C4C|nr:MULTISPECIES: carbon storage regulator CsrA [unclassified Idiomarina]MAD54692.1 carbon storage regulator [Idiomarinaceae bacterium]MEC7641880.1 carbon storage regulator CsrA [Pseudomonadota bacterium]MEC9320043.1 carbon storage regulator CsrA [Pseudomonadota bacterium]NQZ03545.1 carbon storage regulator CsrA [Idiomarina sp.]|tara:strand:+ start:1018 stop:1197 length:180 start_codon:yes stop_codon:yes gene_type:complete
MLILSRRAGETLVINENVKITVVSSTDTQVSLGIEAPREVDIHREEVYQRIQAEKQKNP